MSELFLAEAAVLIRPDTTRFRAELEAELRVATRGLSVAIPVAAATVAGPQLAQQTAAVQQASVQLATLGATQTATATATAKATGASKAKTEAQRLEARAAVQLAVAQEQVLNSTSALGAAQIAATRSATALSNARRANAALTATDSAATRDAVKNTLALAEAQNIQAQSSLRQAQANAASASTMSGLTRGAGAASASMLGVRGATLAATAPFLAATVAVTTFGKAIGSAVSFEQQLAVFGATTDATATQLERVSEAARELGRDITLPGVTAGSAAEAMTELSRAGLGVQDSIDGARGVLQLATAAQLSNADATQLAASALNAFGLSGNQAVRVADLLANAANEAQGGIDEMGLALRQSAGVARQVGISLDDTVGLLTLLARNGLQGSDAGTALRTSLIRLINPTKEARDVLNELNVELRDQQGNIRPEVFAEFAAAQANLSRSQQDANAAIVFGQDAIRALAILGREGQKGLDQVSVALDRQGTAARIAGARMVGLTGETQNLLNQLDALALTLGEKATPLLEALVSAAGDGVADVNALVDAFGDLERSLDRLPGSEGVQDAIGGFLGDALKNPARLFAPITELADDADDAKKEILSAGVVVRGAIEDAAREGVAGAKDFGDQITAALDSALSSVGDMIQRAATTLRNKSLRSIRGGEGQSLGLEEQFNQIIAGGGSTQEQIANLQRQAATQARIIETAGPQAAGVALEARRRAQARLAQIAGQIKGIEDGLVREREAEASAAEQRAREAASARAEADDAFIDLIGGRIAGASNRVTAADATETLNDNIAAETNKREVLKRSIAEVRATVQDAQKRRDELQRLTAQLIETKNDIVALQKEQAEIDREAKKAAALAAQEARDAVTENLAKRTRIAELRENDDATLKGLNRQIADAQKRVAAAKRAKKGVLDEQVALQELIAARRDLIKEMSEEDEETGGGATIASFLTDNTDLFKSIAPNIGTAGIDPLSGFDFSKSIVATLTRFQQAVKPTAGSITAPAGGKPADPSIQRLIEALERNTEAVAGNTSAGGQGFNISRYQAVTGLRAEAMGRFWENRQAQQMTEETVDV